MFNYLDLMSLIIEIWDIVIKGNEKWIDFDNDKFLLDFDILILMGILRRNLDDFCLEDKGEFCELSICSVCICLGIFFIKLRKGMLNIMLLILFVCFF